MLSFLLSTINYNLLTSFSGLHSRSTINTGNTTPPDIAHFRQNICGWLGGVGEGRVVGLGETFGTDEALQCARGVLVVHFMKLS